MPRDTFARPINEVRRSDRSQDDAWIADLLTRAPMGTLATVHDGQPFQNMNLFVYDAETKAIYMHTARYGRTQANVEVDARACFSVSEMGRILPSDTGFDFSVEYAGVTVFGSVSVMRDSDAAKRALQLLLDKYAPHLRPGFDYQTTTDDELKRTAVFQLAIESWSGKRKAESDDFPGAFYYGQLPK